MSPSSWSAALLAAGCVISAIDHVLDVDSPLRRAFCVVRPPGHHAGRNGRPQGAQTQGFCLLNNVA
jgi:acetoin utilization deacetylase AcuC-like enzyme